MAVEMCPREESCERESLEEARLAKTSKRFLLPHSRAAVLFSSNTMNNALIDFQFRRLPLFIVLDAFQLRYSNLYGIALVFLTVMC